MGVTRNVIKGEHREDADGRGRAWRTFGFMWRAIGGYRRLRAELRQELQGWHLRLPEMD